MCDAWFWSSAEAFQEKTKTHQLYGEIKKLSWARTINGLAQENKGLQIQEPQVHIYVYYYTSVPICEQEILHDARRFSTCSNLPWYNAVTITHAHQWIDPSNISRDYVFGLHSYSRRTYRTQVQVDYITYIMYRFCLRRYSIYGINGSWNEQRTSFLIVHRDSNARRFS